MKLAAGILTIIWTLVMVQPAFAYFGGKSAYGKCANSIEEQSTCSKKKPATSACSKKKAEKPACSSKKCNKPSGSEDKDNCKSNGCNPSLGCSSGNFYVHHHYQISMPSWFEQKQKTSLINDNRIVKNMSECFHPPET
jgi:hypothetical protein